MARFKKWVNKTVSAIKKAFKTLKKDKIAIFKGNKLYFYYKKENLE
jgi:hypothetical protein